MDPLYQLWFAVRYLHVASAALLAGGALIVAVSCAVPRARGGAASTVSIVFQTTIAGGWNGTGIFATLVVFGLVSGFVNRGSAAMTFLPVQFLVAVVGTLLAFTIGSVVGMVYGLIDALLLGCGEMLDRWARTCP